MKNLFAIARTSRKMASDLIENYTLDQLNEIPVGFSNNMIWNIGHIVVTQQLLVYKLSGLPMMVSDALIDTYKKGTKVRRMVKQEEVDELKMLLFATLDQTEVDYKNNLFHDFVDYPTSTGFVIKNLESAMFFNNFHEGLHLGIMMNLKKFV